MTTIEDMVECAERELGMRRRVYPGWIEKGRMKQAEADYQIETMAEIVAYLKTERDTPDSKPPLTRRPPPPPPAQGSLL